MKYIKYSILVFLLILGCTNSSTDTIEQIEFEGLLLASRKKIDSLERKLNESLTKNSINEKAMDSLTSVIGKLNNFECVVKETQGSKKIIALNKEIYEKLLHVNIGPHESVNTDGVAYLDTTTYLSKLRGYDIFRNEFIQSEKERIKQCAEDIAAMDYRENNFDLGWEPQSCNFFNYNYWLMSQESPDGFETINIIVNETSASCTIRYYSLYGESKSYWKHKLKIKYLRDEVGKWEVQNITLLEL